MSENLNPSRYASGMRIENAIKNRVAVRVKGPASSTTDFMMTKVGPHMATMPSSARTPLLITC